MNNTKLKFLLIPIVIAAVLPLLFFAPLGLTKNEAANNNTSTDDRVLFPNSASAKIPIEVMHFFKSKVRAGDAVGNVESVIVTDDYVDSENNCEFCTRVEYTPGTAGIAGISYMDEKGFDLTNAKRVTFVAMVLQGDPILKFMVAGKNQDVGTSSAGIFENQKFAKTTAGISLDNNWRKYEIDVSNIDLKNITHPFAFEIIKGKAQGKIIFYLKYVQYDTQTATDPLSTDS
jgi:hypothetical protein